MRFVVLHNCCMQLFQKHLETAHHFFIRTPSQSLFVAELFHHAPHSYTYDKVAVRLFRYECGVELIHIVATTTHGPSTFAVVVPTIQWHLKSSGRFLFDSIQIASCTLSSQ
jgi:hypothetical protein